MMIENIHTGIMGTVCFDGKFKGMRKPQDYIVYPIQAGGDNRKARIQSDKTSGYIDLKSGDVVILDGAHFIGPIKCSDILSGEELLLFKSGIESTASGKAGKRNVFSDNSGASGVLSLGRM